MATAQPVPSTTAKVPGLWVDTGTVTTASTSIPDAPSVEEAGDAVAYFPTTTQTNAVTPVGAAPH